MAKRNEREKDSDLNRTALWTMLSSDEMARIKMKCELSDTNIGEYTRKLIIEDLNKDKKKPPIK